MEELARVSVALEDARAREAVLRQELDQAKTALQRAQAGKADGRKLVPKVYPVADLTGRDPDKGGMALMQIITKTVVPSSWDERGGHGSIDHFAEGRSLVISTTDETHKQVQQLLESLRKVKAEQEKVLRQELEKK